MVGDQNSFLYDNTVQMRFQMIRALRAQYEGRKLASEEVGEIFEEWEPMDEKVFNQTEEAVKKLVLKPSDILDEDDDIYRFKVLFK